jgi:predicted dehydrogenase
MRKLSRREFLENSMFATAAAAAAVPSLQAAEAPDTKKAGPNDVLRVATIGCNGQGGSHLAELRANKDVEVVAICDVDPAAYAKRKAEFEKANRRIPEYFQDIRKLLEKKELDAVTIATPNHWHALAAIWAMQAGKDVYVEKPVSHNVSEGRRIVEVARKLGKICQTGTQSRSMTGMREMLNYIHSGKIGKVSLAKGFCYKPRGSIGKNGSPCTTPAGLDLDLWIGPAPKVDIVRKRFHYDWHWQWAYGNGDLGNQGIHEMDKARWGLGKTELPKSSFSFGGRFGYEDDGETANTQLIFFDYGDAALIFEVRGLKTGDFYKGMPSKIGNLWQGSDGYVVSSAYNSGTAFDLKGNVVKQFKGGAYQAHFANFVKAVRSRRPEDLNADINEGHLSSALCHLGNVSYRLGKEETFASVPKAIAGRKEFAETFEPFKDHLKDNGVKIDDVKLRVGAEVTLDPKTESSSNADVTKLLTREYRKGFEVPAKV